MLNVVLGVQTAQWQVSATWTATLRDLPGAPVLMKVLRIVVLLAILSKLADYDVIIAVVRWLPVT